VLAVAAPAIDPAADCLSKLPGEILAQILSFLPTEEVVRTCILARTWRDACKLNKRLLITGNAVDVAGIGIDLWWGVTVCNLCGAANAIRTDQVASTYETPLSWMEFTDTGIYIGECAQPGPNTIFGDYSCEVQSPLQFLLRQILMHCI
jgi:hypothetical protein